ncbi:hypothetical protein CH267_00990 [Rhodococcus sp. 06-621-2]|nr:NUMOD4 motif-containing HNH endonuclease [Rhodococcus sp. 06-621-2]OZC62149.1 hypothetical protein CH267_00990 [Rhodococcus sp. 06-621-2]
MIEERWRSVVGFEGAYEVSDFGNVRSLDRAIVTKAGVTIHRKGAVKRPSPHPDGHIYVRLSKANTPSLRSIHTLMMEAFVGPCPKGQEVLHSNGIGTDNRLPNLRYGTRSENAADQVRHGVHNMARKTHCFRGHQFTAENTYMHPSGSRACIECRRIYKRAWRLRKKNAA